MKAEIALALDERGLVRPDLMRRALEANERAKYHLSLLQMARMHADAPYATAPTLSSDRVHAGIDDERLDSVIESAVALGDAYRIPGARGIVDAALRETREMIDPLRASADPSASSFEGRLDAIAGEI